LGQSATTLSGGEAQRMKLARELSRRQTGRTLYILDEPTTGLHFDDVKKLLDVLNRLVDLGNTVLIIEHHLDVIKQADWVMDLGPKAAKTAGASSRKGHAGTVARNKKSYTGPGSDAGAAAASPQTATEPCIAPLRGAAFDSGARISAH
jgi:excinuclease ABC subunit A